MIRFNRDKIWFTAWACVPVAVVLNLFLAAPAERMARLTQQAQVDGAANHWVNARKRYEAAAYGHPESAMAAHNAAVANAKLDDWEGTARWTLEALDRDPEFERAVLGLKELHRMHPQALASAEAHRDDP